jgi:transitional endoplasmic reticulum ATPase
MTELKCVALGGLSENTVAVSLSTAQQYDWRNGQPMGIRGGRQTVGILKIQKDVSDGDIGIGPTLRINAKIREAESVEVVQLEANSLSKVKMQPVNDDISQEQINEVVRSIHDIYVSKGDHLVFTIHGEPIEFQIIRCRPGHGWLTGETELGVEKRRTRRPLSNLPTVSFDDIGGLDDTIEAIKEIAIVPIVHPEVYMRTGQEPPKGIVLYGPPGVGKTMLAKALSREAQTTFHSISGPEIMRGVYGESEKILREMFEQARKDSPSVIYIDEIDAITGDRDKVSGELEKRVLTQLLTLMDGFEERGRVLVIGSTNRLDSIDKALLRAGRFDRRIHVPYPDIEGRAKILEIHTKMMPLADMEIDDWARKTNGYTGADIANLCRHASTACLRRQFGLERLITSDDFSDEELEKIEVKGEDFTKAFDLVTPIAVAEHRPASMGHIDFENIIGHEEAKRILNDHIVLPIQNPDIYEKLALTCAGGVILHGPPGTGKTMLGRAAASVAGVQFMAISGPEMLSKWVGESERAVRELFQRAQDLAPVVLFFDEFDAIGRQRNGGESSVHSSSVVAQLLTLMDGLNHRSDIFMMASTNQLELVDSAFLRPGRFDRAISVEKLPASNYSEFFSKVINNIPNNISEEDIDELSGRLSDPLPGAELAGLVTSAKRAAALRTITEKLDSVQMTINDFETALNSSQYLLRGLGGDGGAGYV